jgi:hypothetical protein
MIENATPNRPGWFHPEELENGICQINRQNEMAVDAMGSLFHDRDDLAGMIWDPNSTNPCGYMLLKPKVQCPGEQL